MLRIDLVSGRSLQWTGTGSLAHTPIPSIVSSWAFLYFGAEEMELYIVISLEKTSWERNGYALTFQ